jgi:glyoxylase-like metal-dependent hydrolase (beta-lactamase superfamily II)
MAVVVDPLPEMSLYLKAPENYGLNLSYVIDTHIHADHLSGAKALADLTGAELVMHQLSPLQVSFTPVTDGDRLVLGTVEVNIWHTPGHTPEHISLVVTDRRRGPEPWCVLTGHTLMVGDAGRPDLLPDDGSLALYHSLFDRLAALPDYVEIYPGAYAGST